MKNSKINKEVESKVNEFHADPPKSLKNSFIESFYPEMQALNSTYTSG